MIISIVIGLIFGFVVYKLYSKWLKRKSDAAKRKPRSSRNRVIVVDRSNDVLDKSIR
tara:strand:+ start:204 stop:374 length:171 start_codon:yes stop_codon:yes gene_type:complete